MTTARPLAEQLGMFIAALDAFHEEVAGMTPFFRAFGRAFLAGCGPTTRRRMLRDWARANRRPSLIHNGRKAR